MLPLLHVKDPGHFAKKWAWQAKPKHAYTLDPAELEWADYYCPRVVWEANRERAHVQGTPVWERTATVISTC